MKKYIKLMRVHHYIKNLLIFLALACSGKIFDADKFKNGVIGFLTFSFLTSGVYIINDIKDKDKDRLHPKKCKRPIASGEISIKKSIILAIVLFTISIIGNILFFNWSITLLLIGYMVINIAYSCGMKNIPLLDISILVSGFLIRIIYGAKITDIRISNWLYLTVIAMAFYLSLGKRRNELRCISQAKTREVLKYYSDAFLDKNMYMCLTLANVFYALWSMDKNNIRLYGGRRLIFTVPIVLLISMKYSLNIEKEIDGDPVEVFFHDKAMILLSILYVGVMFAIVYLT